MWWSLIVPGLWRDSGDVHRLYVSRAVLGVNALGERWGVDRKSLAVIEADQRQESLALDVLVNITEY